MKRTLLLALTALAIFLVSSCQKDDLGRVLTATIEQYEHNGSKADAKAYINAENYACWEAGDLVKINNTQCTIRFEEGSQGTANTAIIDGASLPSDQDLLAFYPASQVSSWNENNVTISLPPIQTYEERNGHQIINNPMAAYCPANSNTLRFRNLCALLKVTIQAPSNEDLAVKTIIVKGNENQMLWGSAPLILDYQNKPMLDEMSNGSAYVGLSFGNHPATISANSTKSFYIVVPVPSAFTNLTIHVVTNQGVYRKESPLGQALLRNHIGAFTYAPSCADVDNVSTILYEGSIEDFFSDAFGEAQVIFNEGGSLIFDRPLTTIGNGAFYGCSSLSSITLPTGVTSIGNAAFRSCSMLSRITLPASLTSIGDDAFDGCSSLGSIDLSLTDVTTIGESAFSYCNALSSISLPRTLTMLGERAFSHCTALSRIDLSHTEVTSIGVSAFSHCTALSSISLPGTLTWIGELAFEFCNALSSIDLSHTGVISIGVSAFSNCNALSSISLPTFLTSIGNYAFINCSALTDIDLSNTEVTSIGNYTFHSCNTLTTISLPATLTSIGNYAFIYCNNLTTMNCHAITPPTLDPYALDDNNISNDAHLYVPGESVSSYNENQAWHNYFGERIYSLP